MAALLCALSIVASADDPPRAMGYRPPPRGVAVRRVASAQGARFLRASSRTALPSRWDSCEHGWVSSVKNQGNVGSCWTFAACAVIETQLLKAGRGEWDLSEKNMANLHGFEPGFSSGGNNDMAAAYLLRWGGAVAETNDVYIGTKSNWTDSKPLVPALRIQNVVWVPDRSSSDDNDTLKKAIMDYGAVSTAILWNFSYESTSNYYCNVDSGEGHAITVIGWDDNYPASNFNHTPAGDGAYLIKNSWGTGKGDKGYYWVSYYDTSFAMWGNSVFIPATDDENYDAVYGYDKLGYVGDINDGIVAAAFTSAWNEELAAVGVYSYTENCPYEVSVYTNVTRTTSTSTWRPLNPLAGGALACTVSGTLATAGFTTVHLPNPVKLADRTNFVVVYKQNIASPGYIVSYSCDFEDGTPYSRVTASLGNTYWGSVSSRGKTSWTDLATENAVACLKAYTRSTVAVTDAPSEVDDGTAALEWLAVTNATLYAETSETFGAFAGLVGANGRSLWTSWLAGFDPSVEGSAEFTVSIDVSGGVPSLTWSPDLGAARTYTVWGRETLGTADQWEPVNIDDIGTSQFKFFKVTVGQ